MGKRSFGFSERAAAGAAKTAMAFLVLASAPAWAPAPWARADALLDAFLSLPALDLEREPVQAAPDAAPSANIRVGDRVKFVISKSQLPTGAAKLALPGEADRPGSFNESPDKLMDQGVDLTFPDAPEVVVVAIKPGAVPIPSLVIKDGQGKSIARTNPLQFEVETAISSTDPQPEQVAADRGPIALPFPRWIIVTGAVFGLILLGLLIWLLVRLSRRKRIAGPILPALPPRPEHELALEAIREVERSDWMAKGEYKRHFFRVSEILKGYVGARFSFDAPESTTREMIEALEGARAVNLERLDQLELLFRSLDQVKFTDHVPTKDEGARVLEVAARWVNETRRPDVVDPILPRSANASGGARASR